LHLNSYYTLEEFFKRWKKKGYFIKSNSLHL
jgi:hypothetical protein